ncbi:MAG: 5-(carboxyamino)imidazole ribonucleotide mutase [Parcubacteria group bacterium Gr01-1014_38]|nr:MAG: 5-(carboxyamino)imidazole ribonucleotide mutase [Parcubacteria group bacterium Gr01-1014_38]
MPQVVVILGSESDRKVVDESQMPTLLDEVGVSWELSIISAHRNPQELQEYCAEMERQHAMMFIGVAGMAAALPGAIAANVGARLPVIGVPLISDVLDAHDALYSMVRMPPHMPVAVCGIGKSGLINAAMFACQIVAAHQEPIRAGMERYIQKHAKPAQVAVQKGKVS